MAFILSRYIGRHIFLNILIAFTVVLSIAGLIDLVEMFRRTADKEGITFYLTFKMALLRLPHLGEKLLPYSVLIGSMMALMKLTRTSELVIVRNAGVSVWRFLTPALLIAIMLGIASIVVLNPLAATTLAQYERLESHYIQGNSQLFSVSSSGLWLRQLDTSNAIFADKPIGAYILQASYISQSDMKLSEVVIFVQDDALRFIGRIDAAQATLLQGKWELKQVMISIPGRVPEYPDIYYLPTDLTLQQIQDSFAEPRTLSFWQLSSFIDTLEKAGFSALRHKLHWYSTLFTPLVFAAMVLLSAMFSLRQPRRGRLMLMVFGAVITGFTLNFLTGLFQAFGYAGDLSIEAAVLAPQLLAVLASTLVLLHVEDG